MGLQNWPEILNDLIGLPTLSNTVGLNMSLMKMFASMTIFYLFAWIERNFFTIPRARSKNQKNRPVNLLNHHLYHIILGFLTLYYCFGSDIIYCYFVVVAQFLILALDRYAPQISSSLSFISDHKKGNHNFMIIFTWLFQVGFLCYGYSFAYAESTEYVINWTMPSCMLCLKMIMIMYDCADGRAEYPKVKGDRIEDVVKLDESPNFIEFLAYSTYYNTIFIGPLMTIQHYRKFLNGVYIKNHGVEKFIKETRNIAIQKFMTALVMFIIFAQFLAKYIDDSKDLGFSLGICIQNFILGLHSKDPHYFPENYYKAS